MTKRSAEIHIGDRFERLIVIEFVSKDKYGALRWRCICDCGQKREVIASNLRTGNVRSCGCLRQEAKKASSNLELLSKIRPQKDVPRPYIRKPGGAFRTLLWTYRDTAKRKGREFSIPEDVFRILTSSPCFYCGVAPFKATKTKLEQYIYNGLDRKDNSIGYTVANSVPCCWPCNELKGDRNSDVFLVHIQRIIAACPDLIKL